MARRISSTVRRRYILGRQGLWPGRRWRGKAGTAAALQEVEAVQIDPVSVVAQSHDIVLWGRVTDYRPEQLAGLLYEDRAFFDYGGGLMIYPMEELPYWRVVMERKKRQTRWADFAEANPAALQEVRRELRERGPLRKRDLDGRPVDDYRGSKDTGVALYYLWLAGELMSFRRQGKERVYDFLENVAPEHLRDTAAEAESDAYFARKAIALLGLANVRAFRNRWKGFIERPVDVKEAKAKLFQMEEAGELAAVHLEKGKEPYYFLASDAPLLEELIDGRIPADWRPLETTTGEEVTFLSPLEYVSARGRAAGLFDFDYIWEIYKPAGQRKYGPYTMPVLYGDRLVARIDASFERSSRTLLVNGFWLEDWFATDAGFEDALAKGLARFSWFLGAERVKGEALDPGLWPGK
jgi:uncharacterized protein YcaQ